MDLPPVQIRYNVASSDGEDGVDEVLRSPIAAEEEPSLIEKGDVGDDQRQYLGTPSSQQQSFMA